MEWTGKVFCEVFIDYLYEIAVELEFALVILSEKCI